MEDGMSDKPLQQWATAPFQSWTLYPKKEYDGWMPRRLKATSNNHDVMHGIRSSHYEGRIKF